jgi:hypothetical protein
VKKMLSAGCGIHGKQQTGSGANVYLPLRGIEDDLP